jgi:hypothetical protein
MTIVISLITAWLILYAAARYFQKRDRVYEKLHSEIRAIDSVTAQMDIIFENAGRTVGEIRNAGMEEKHDELWKEGGKHYREAVKHAAFLMYWPVGVFFYKRRMLKAYDSVGLFSGCMGSYQAYEDVRNGSASDTNYYPCEHLKGLSASLATAPFII